MNRLHFLSLSCLLSICACAPPTSAPSDGANGADAGPSPAVVAATEPLSAAGYVCSAYPRERQLATWVFVDTGVELIPDDPSADYQVRLTAGAWTETRWIRGRTVVRRWFGGLPVTVRYLDATAPPSAQCIWAGTFHY